MYNKFSCSRYSRVEPRPPEPKKRPGTGSHSESSRKSQRAENIRRENRPFGSLLPAGVDTGDILLLLVLLFLYFESEDEEFLIILIAVGLSVFRVESEGGIQSLLSSLL